MNSPASTENRGLLIFSTLSVFFLACFVYRDGVNASPDSWAFWEGSASILRSGRFEHSTGEPIISWLPTFSIYLAGWELIFGTTGLALVAAMISLVTLAHLFWTLYFLTILRAIGPDSEAAAPKRLLTLVPAVFLLSTMSLLHAQVLQLTVLPLILLGCFRIFTLSSDAAPTTCIRVVALTGISFTVALLTHHSSIYLGGFVLLYVFLSRLSLARKALAVVAALLLPVLLWYAARSQLGQSSSHLVEWSAGLHLPSAYLKQIATGVSLFFQPSRFNPNPWWFLALLCLHLFFLVKRVRVANRTASFVLVANGWVALCGLFVLFNIVLIGDPLTGRFLIAPVLLLLAGTILLVVSSNLSIAIRSVLCGLLLCKSVGRTATNCVEGLDTIPRPSGFEHIYPHWTLAPGEAVGAQSIVVPPRPGLLAPPGAR